MKKRKIHFIWTAFAILLITFLSSYYYVFIHLSSVSKINLANIKRPENDVISEKIRFDLLSHKHNAETILSFAGDCTIGSDPNFSYNTFHQKYESVDKNPEYFFSNMKTLFSNDDLTIVNFEGTLTTSNRKANKKFTFKGPPEYAKILSAGSIESVNLANNHTYDYLQKGYTDTRQALSDEKINYFGLGDIYKTTINSIPFAFLGYKGWLDTLNVSSMVNEIETLKEDGYFVVVNFHWGLEGRYHPTSDQTYVAHKAIDSGADLIIGHHPHVLEGFELYKDKLIAYSLGNFCFGGNSNPKDKRTMVLQLKLSKNDDKTLNSYFRVIPAKLSSVDNKNDFMPTIMTDEDNRNSFFHFINDISPEMPFYITDDYTSLWQE